MPTTAQLREVMARYAAAASSKDRRLRRALHAGRRPGRPLSDGSQRRRDAIRAFIQRSFDACETMTFEVLEVHPVGDRAAITFHITVTLEGGSTMHIRGVEVFTVTDDGFISAVDGLLGRRGRDLRVEPADADGARVAGGDPGALPGGRRSATRDDRGRSMRTWTDP